MRAWPELWRRVWEGVGRVVARTLNIEVRDDGLRAGKGWGMLSTRPHERDFSEVQELYEDVIEAWRKNPMAKRAIDITTDYVIGDGITISSSFSLFSVTLMLSGITVRM